MKKFIVLPFVLLSMQMLLAQNLKFGASIGSGLFAIEEHNDKKINTNFSAPLTFSLSAGIIDRERHSFGIKLLYADSRVSGYNWLTHEPLDGIVSIANYFGYYERLWTKNRLSHSFIFGLGISNENYLTQLESIPKERNYASVFAGYGLSYGITAQSSLRMEITPLASDFFNGVRYFFADWKGQSVGEDIHLFVNFGIDYRIGLTK